MAITAAEQYAIELVNRARLDPLSEAKAYGVSLNAGLKAGTISSSPKEPLAPLEALSTSAEAHGAWILSADTFSHTGQGGSDAGDRIVKAGYPKFIFKTDAWGENLSLISTQKYSLEQLIDAHHAAFMNSSSHRAEMLLDNLRAVGIAEVQGTFTQGSANYNVSVQVQNFAYRESVAYVTGVIYSDRDGDDFYSIGEGRSGLDTRIIGGEEGTSMGSGGYALAGLSGAKVAVVYGKGAGATKIEVDLSQGNVKVDLVDGTLLKVSGNVTLISGIANVTALGIAGISLTGSAYANVLTGNSGANRLAGGDGNDRLIGQSGNDILTGEAGADTLLGGLGNDLLDGGAGSDSLVGGGGRDKMTGGAGADDFVFFKGDSWVSIVDFNAAEGDHLQLDADLWSGRLSASSVVLNYAEVTRDGVELDFGNGNVILLSGLTKLLGLAAAIEII